ncbi:uncharacterized protein LOC123404402 [Hordeum vulgare subsp. vulgare]|uniref:uncharacterized protein LOC123404402 n=1 Tax=Hordeum vulgare subsp. vulgare TaxID=112509 RepID=UPI001D1A3C03|nr:uncharacterized protein LOC123404402 [Hordeum vulgare subsp. vulgare]
MLLENRDREWDFGGGDGGIRGHLRGWDLGHSRSRCRCCWFVTASPSPSDDAAAALLMHSVVAAIGVCFGLMRGGGCAATLVEDPAYVGSTVVRSSCRCSPMALALRGRWGCEVEEFSPFMQGEVLLEKQKCNDPAGSKQEGAVRTQGLPAMISAVSNKKIGGKQQKPSIQDPTHDRPSYRFALSEASAAVDLRSCGDSSLERHCRASGTIALLFFLLSALLLLFSL